MVEPNSVAVIDAHERRPLAFRITVVASGACFLLMPHRDPEEPRFWCVVVAKCGSNGLGDPAEAGYIAQRHVNRNDLADTLLAIRTSLDAWLAEPSREPLLAWLLASPPTPVWDPKTASLPCWTRVSNCLPTPRARSGGQVFGEQPLVRSIRYDGDLPQRSNKQTESGSMIARRPRGVLLPHPVLTLVLAVVLAIAGPTGFGGASAQSDACHPAYGNCLPVVDDLNCDDIGDQRIEVLNVDDDPYGLDVADGPGNGITCDGDDGEDAPADSSALVSESEPTGSAGLSAASTLGGSSGWADAEADYLTTIRLMLRAVSESLGRAEKLINAPLPADEHWKANLGAEITIWQVMYAQALQMTPPAAFSELHPLVLDYLRLCSEAGNEVATWAVTSDAASLDQSKATLAQADTVIDEAWTVLEGIRETRGIPTD